MKLWHRIVAFYVGFRRGCLQARIRIHKRELETQARWMLLPYLERKADLAQAREFKIGRQMERLESLEGFGRG